MIGATIIAVLLVSGLFKMSTGHAIWYWIARIACCLEAAQDRLYDSVSVAALNFRDNYRFDVERVRADVARPRSVVVSIRESDKETA